MEVVQSFVYLGSELDAMGRRMALAGSVKNLLFFFIKHVAAIRLD